MAEIMSRPPNQAFRDNMDRIFGNEKHENFFVTETHCELCKWRQTGCPYQYDSEDCQLKRVHFKTES